MTFDVLYKAKTGCWKRVIIKYPSILYWDWSRHTEASFSFIISVTKPPPCCSSMQILFVYTSVVAQGWIGTIHTVRESRWPHMVLCPTTHLLAYYIQTIAPSRGLQHWNQSPFLPLARPRKVYRRHHTLISPPCESFSATFRKPTQKQVNKPVPTSASNDRHDHRVWTSARCYDTPQNWSFRR